MQRLITMSTKERHRRVVEAIEANERQINKIANRVRIESSVRITSCSYVQFFVY